MKLQFLNIFIAFLLVACQQQPAEAKKSSGDDQNQQEESATDNALTDVEEVSADEAPLEIMASPKAGEPDGHHITFKFKNAKDTELIIAYHFGTKQYVHDTFEVNSKGIAELKGDEPIPGGLYLAVVPGQPYFEFLIADQHFTLETDLENPIQSMKVKNSPNNEVFFKDLLFIGDLRQQKKKLADQLNQLEGGSEEAEKLETEIAAIDRQVIAQRKQIIRDNPDLFYSKMLQANLEPEVGDLDDDGKAFFKYRDAYIGNVDLADERLLRTPVYQAKVDFYLKNLVSKAPDSIIVAVDKLVAGAAENDETYKFMLNHLTSKYERSKIMSMDAVFVHLVESYYHDERVDWIDEAKLIRIQEKAKNLKPLLIGKRAPNILMRDDKEELKVLYGTEADFTILYFWDPDCSHCKKATPKVADVARDFKEHNVKVYAVCTEAEKDKWLKAIEKYEVQDWINVADPEFKSTFRGDYDISSTPITYLLDDQKEILAKKITPEQLREILEHYINEKSKK